MTGARSIQAPPATTSAPGQVAVDPHPGFEPIEVSSTLPLLLEAGLALALILGLFVLVARFLPRLLGRDHDVPAEPIEVLAARRLEPRRSVYLLRVDGRRLVVGSSENGLRPLGEWPDEPASAEEQS